MMTVYRIDAPAARLEKLLSQEDYSKHKYFND